MLKALKCVIVEEISEPKLFPCDSAILLKRTDLYSKHSLHTSSDSGRELHLFAEIERLAIPPLPLLLTLTSWHQILWRRITDRTS